MEKITLKQYKALSKSIITSRINYIDNIQKFIIFFVTEYNGLLSENCTSFCKLLEGLQKYSNKDFQLIVKYLKKYTNIKNLLIKDCKLQTLAVDKKTFMFTCKIDELPIWNIQEKVNNKKQLNSESFKTSLKALYKKYAEVEGLDDSLKHILTIINI